MSAAGWVAMLLGIVVTLALGIGLMSLVFISNRRGYDERGVTALIAPALIAPRDPVATSDLRCPERAGCADGDARCR